jgi:LIVCS family branched-chain amino acid:cation transporter
MFSRLDIFLDGLIEGYKTFDLFASIFFSAVILSMFKKNLDAHSQRDYKKLGWAIFKSSLIGAGLLSIVYVGMSFVAAAYSQYLNNVADQQLLLAIANHVLGNAAGLIVSLAVALACLTTAIALAVVSAEFLEKEIFLGRVKYEICLAISLLISIPVSGLHFDGLMRILVPILKVTYPAVIVLVIFNILNKLFDIKLVKTPFYLTLLATFLIEFGNKFWSL